MKNTSKIYILPAVMMGVTAVAGIVTSVPGANAENISPVDDEITVTVDSACTMGIISSSSMTGIIPGETKGTGSYRMAAYCNDNNGYDIYAIGYTNGEYGNTNMISTDGNIIPTGTSGEDSYWNMQLSPGTATDPTTHIPTIVSPFTSINAIPNDYVKVATYPSTTIPQGTDPIASGSYFDASYQTHASVTQPAGTYTGQVQYVMVHPQGAPAPEKPLTINDLTYMQEFATLSEEDRASVFKSMSYGKQYTLKDNRDQKSYYISKLRDDNVWMTQNLDHDIVAGKIYTSADTDLPSSTSWTPASNEATYPTGTTTWNFPINAPESYDPGNRYWDASITTDGGTIGNNTVTNPSATSGGVHYHIGNYYNWTAAVAMSSSASYASGDVNQSICPAGWRLPTISGGKSYQNLIDAQSLFAGTGGNIQNNPAYFAYGGSWYGSSYYVGRYGFYWSSTLQDSSSAYLLVYNASGELNSQNGVNKFYSASLRCVAR